MTMLGAWVLTYLIHSTLLIGAVAIVVALMRKRPEVASPLWKAALVGGIVTATVQLGLGVQPWGGVTVVATPTASVAPRVGTSEAVVTSPAMSLDFETAAAPTLSVPSDATGRSTVIFSSASVTPTAAAQVAAASPPVTEPVSAPTGSLWPTVLATLLLLGVLLGVLSIVTAVAGLRRRLKGRQPVHDGPLAQLLGRLLDRAETRRTVVLSVAPHVTVPMATGLMRSEIVVPQRVVEQMPAAHQETLLAHELAHVLRRDPAWRVAGLLIERVLFFQPLNRLATRGMAQSAEYLCDDWAASRTRRPLDLARCLTEVAAWCTDARESAMAPAAVGAGPKSILGRRVTRLLETRRGGAATSRRVAVGLAGLAMVAVVAAAPGVATGRPAAVIAADSTPADASVISLSAGGADNEVVIVGVDEEGERTQVVISSEGIEISQGAAAPTPGTSGKTTRRSKREASKARRKSKKKLRKAFRKARKQGKAAPDATDLAGIFPERSDDAEAFELKIVVPADGEPQILFRGGETIRLDELERDVQKQVERALRAHRFPAPPAPPAAPHAHRNVERLQRHAERLQKDAARMEREVERTRRDALRQYRHAQRSAARRAIPDKEMKRALEQAEHQRVQQMRRLEGHLRALERRRVAPAPPALPAPPAPPLRFPHAKPKAPRAPAPPTPPAPPRNADIFSI